MNFNRFQKKMKKNFKIKLKILNFYKKINIKMNKK